MPYSISYKKLLRIVVVVTLLFFLHRFFIHTTAVGLISAPLSIVNIDVGLWVFSITGFTQNIVSNTRLAILFDGSLFASGILVFIYPGKRIFILVYGLLLYSLGILYIQYSMSGHIAFSGCMLIMFPFLLKGKKFLLSWEAVRYFTCLIYFLSFLWKIKGGSFMHWQNGEAVVQLSQLSYIFHHPNSLFASCIQWFLNHGWLLNAATIGIVLLEGIMVVGFFTRKYDRWLFWCPILIHSAIYFFVDISYLELLVLDLSLLFNNVGLPLILLPKEQQQERI